MLRSELSYLQECVSSVLNWIEGKAKNSDMLNPEKLGAQLAGCTADLQERLTREVFGPAKDHVIRRYIQFHQAGLVAISDELFAALRAKTDYPIQGRSQLLVQALEQVEKCFEYIEHRFYAYYDPQHPLTNFRCDRTAQKLRAAVEKLAPLFILNQIEAELAEVFFSSLDESLMNARSLSLDLNQVNYLDRLIQNVQELLETGQFSSADLGDFLYQQNFNSPAFEDWYRSQLINQPERGHNFKPVFQETGIAASRRAIDVLLKEWLSEQQYATDKPSKSSPKSGAIPQLPLHLSVPQLALFTRLCYLEGCFQITNISTIMRFFTLHFETKKQLNISLKSFGRAFYATDQSTAAAVRDYLQRMIILLDKLYFPKN